MEHDKQWLGISFPFRIGLKGGIEMSKGNIYDTSHIEESIIQILTTDINSRIMESYFGSSISSSIFEVDEEATHTLIKHEVHEALTMFEPRITVNKEDITIEAEDSALYVIVRYKLTNLYEKYYTTRKIKLNGGD